MAYEIREVSDYRVHHAPIAAFESMEAALAYMTEKFEVLAIDVDEENDAADILATAKNGRLVTPIQFAIEAH